MTNRNTIISLPLHVLIFLLFREMDEAAGEFDIAEYYRLHIAVERIRFVYTNTYISYKCYTLLTAKF